MIITYFTNQTDLWPSYNSKRKERKHGKPKPCTQMRIITKCEVNNPNNPFVLSHDFKHILQFNYEKKL